MVEKIANSITGQMIDFRLIDNTKKEHYVYALVLIMEKFITVAIIITISAYMKMVVPTVLFLIFFFALRSRTGGYHANSFLSCFVGTILSYTAIISVIYPLFLANKIIMYTILILCVLIIEVIGAVNHPNWDLSLDELYEAKKAARLVTILECCCILIAEGMGIDEACVVFMSVAIILCAISLSVSKIIKQEVNEYEETN